MRQRIDPGKLYDLALRQVELPRHGGKRRRSPPGACPVTLDQLLTASVPDLEASFAPGED
jgi:hypothetical protein